MEKGAVSVEAVNGIRCPSSRCSGISEPEPAPALAQPMVTKDVDVEWCASTLECGSREIGRVGSVGTNRLNPMEDNA